LVFLVIILPWNIFLLAKKDLLPAAVLSFISSSIKFLGARPAPSPRKNFSTAKNAHLWKDYSHSGWGNVACFFEDGNEYVGVT